MKDTRRFGCYAKNFKRIIPALFGIDYRAIKAFRVGLALLVLGDLCERSANIEAFYTDSGVLPRALLRLPSLRFSIHALVGGSKGEWILFLFAALCALLFLLGIWSRVAATASWFLLASLDARNPFVLNEGDTLLKILLFWSIFLPLSQEVPQEAAKKEGRYCSAFSAAVLIQVSLAYVFTALLKTDPSWRITGTAISAALRLEHLTTSVGRALLEWTMTLRAATHFVYYLEMLGPFLVFLPWNNRRVREVTIAAFIAMHLGIAVTMNVGLFPWVSIVGWIPFIPSETLDAFQGAITAGRSQAPHSPTLTEAPSLRSGILVQALVFCLLADVIAWNVRGLNGRMDDEKLHLYDIPLRLVQLDQQWFMFAPRPSDIVGWYVAEAALNDGSLVDIMNGGESVSRERPQFISQRYIDFRWRKFLIDLQRPQLEKCRQPLAVYLKNSWDRQHPPPRRIQRLTVYFVWVRVSSAGATSPEAREVARY